MAPVADTGSYYMMTERESKGFSGTREQLRLSVSFTRPLVFLLTSALSIMGFRNAELTFKNQIERKWEEIMVHITKLLITYVHLKSLVKGSIYSSEVD